MSQVNEAIGTTCKINGQVVSLAAAAQFINQLKGVLFTMVFAAAGTFVILKIDQRLWPAARQRGGRDPRAGS